MRDGVITRRNTTIAISIETKKLLFEIRNMLENKEKKRMGYSDVIDYLIDEYKNIKDEGGEENDNRGGGK
jgi:hypothetical protein